MNDLPAPPPLPADVDLRDYTFMPIDIGRLFGSEFHARASDAEWRAGVTLWLKSYHQVPAASLPDDDVALARLAELGKDIKAWRKIRTGALRGWTKCSDGRLYHRTVAEKALEGWIEKLAQGKSSGAGNAKRYGHPFDPTPIEQAIIRCRELLAALNPQSRVLAKRGGKPPTGTPDAPPDGSPGGTAGGSPDDIPTTSHRGPKGQGQGQERESSLRSDRARATLTPDVIASKLFEASGGNVDRTGAAIEVVGPIEDLIALGCDFDRHVLPVVREAVPRLDQPLRTWGARWLRNEILAAKARDAELTRAALEGRPDEPGFDFGDGQKTPYSLIRMVRNKGAWLSEWGPEPGRTDCKIPPDLLAEIMSEGAAA